MRLTPVLLLFLLWSITVFLTPESVFWRDSGEFIVQGFALDITHPAGFPAYGMVANLFALLPFGPIPWRIILVSGAAFILMAWWTALIIHEIARRFVDLPIGVLSVATALVLVLAAGALPLMLKQVMSAEVYLLNAALMLLVTLLSLRGMNSSSFHYLGSAAFIGGLSIGNHISSGLAGLLLAVALLASSRIARNRAIKLLCLVMLGLMVYAYLPVRATTSIPLNTGEPTTITRFWNVISDARDRKLRSSGETAGVPVPLAGFDQLIANPFSNLQSDLGKLRFGDIDNAAIIVLLLIAPLALGTAPEVLILSAVAIGNYCFFAGWDGDPWPLAVAMISILVVSGIIRLTIIPRGMPNHRAMPILVLCLLVAVYYFPVRETFAELQALRSYRTPAEVTEAWLESSTASLVISENTWFLARYLSDIEGIGDERVIVYPPSLYFPEYFNAAKIQFPGGKMFDSRLHARAAGIGETEPSFNTLGQLIEMASQYTPILIEPGVLINSTLHTVMTLTEGGSVEIQRGRNAETDAEGARKLATRFARLATEAESAPGFIRGDARNYLENLLNNNIDLLKRGGNYEAASALLESLCAPPSSGRCSVVSLNNLGLTYLSRREFMRASELYLQLFASAPESVPALEQNALTAFRGLSPAERSQISTAPGAATWLERISRITP